MNELHRTDIRKGVHMKARASLLVAAAILIVSASALTSARIDSRQDRTDDKRQKEIDENRSEVVLDDDDDECEGPAVRLPATKLFIEHNSTDEDTGVHGLF